MKHWSFFNFRDEAFISELPMLACGGGRCGTCLPRPPGKLIANTPTKTRAKIRAGLDTGVYPTGITVSDE